MRILLAVPNSHCGIRDHIGSVSLPLGLGYIASYLQQSNEHEIQIHDGLLASKKDKKFSNIVETFQPEIVGISSQATPSIYDVYRDAKLVKKINPDTIVVVGGAHVTYLDQSVLQECSQIDIVVRGEGEVIMNRLVNAISENRGYNDVLGITYRNGESIVRNPKAPYVEDLDSIPFPAYDLMEPRKYFTHGVRFSTMISSRGCPFGCRFCTSSKLVGRIWRARSPENILQELEYVVREYGIENMAFIDDLFTLDPKRVYRICESISKSRIDVGWACTSRVDIISKYPQMTRWLEAAGCHTIYMGVESGSQRILDLMGKKITLKQAKKAVKVARMTGMVIILSFILGYPGESEKDLQNTIDFACELDPDYAQFAICTPYPGSQMYDDAIAEGWLTTNDWKHFTGGFPIMSLPELKSECIKQYLYKAYLKFYTRLGYIQQKLREKHYDFFKRIPKIVKGYIQQGG